METELRVGQCHDSLVQLRTKLNAQARLVKYKYVNVRHQIPNTRSRNSLGRVNAKIEAFATKYRHAFLMLCALDPRGTFGWRSDFLELRSQDVRGLSQPELPKASTQACAEKLQERSLLSGGALPEGNRTVSWIWRGSLTGDNESPNKHAEFGEGKDFATCMVSADIVCRVLN